MVQQVTNDIQLFASIDAVALQLVQLLNSHSEEVMNKIPFKGSWTAAQVAEHIKKSVTSIAQAMQMQGKMIYRNPEEKAAELKNMFLDFTIKLKSPEFIIPRQGYYNKQDVINNLRKAFENLKEESSKAVLTDAITHPAFNEITKLELLHFVLYHTQRHLHQAAQIFEKLHH